MNTTSMDDRTRAAETEAIERVVAEIQYAQRNELPDRFAALFRHDAIWTTGHGKRLIGRDEIAEFTRKVLPGSSKHGLGTYEVVHILFIRPDVAAVKVRQRYVTPDGELIESEGEGTPLHVMSKEDGRWFLTASQNTQVFAE
ncbi:SgcJ/EcaC family oxidoreductase [Streptomyces uncialis]|uniref:SgcJ/EcaC family oxidoreductase n=1 Tax=Streptomyces uncialis TaxID=1048205 RepID=UPI003863E967|nr:SgcJ/EcaC family oxidoreductase [Streptomyces uncialis]